MKNSLFRKDIVTVESLTTEDVELIFEKTREMERLVKEKGGDDRLKGKIMAALFYEPSTRTFSSFIAAMQKLGGGIIPLNGMKNTSVEKGESFKHTIQVFSRYADCLVVRHPEPGMPAMAAGYVDMPVINAGDGINEHPTQALFDTYTIHKHFAGLDNLKVALVGDLKNGRTVHSLSQVLAKMGKNLFFHFVSPAVLKMPEEIKKIIKSSGTNFSETDNLSSVISESDVIYMTRVQKERFTDITEYERLKSFYMLEKKMLNNAKKRVIIMHPLPIAAGEISNDLDTDLRSVYLKEQLSNGLYLRMALLDLILRR
ncbi:aspartate carbamoyltransferase [Candidatus Gottesmanbacteria bacterium]|nr:aspartate carbamoyltransferase [Candidatus Gottesmanbacteria bacterium]MBI5452801.1 aspartate carbamoyltransferase [Candidatus Gottesmanbacteria bacterium]